jgi:hypothetical protein
MFVSNREEAGVRTLKTAVVKDSKCISLLRNKTTIRIRTTKTKTNNNKNLKEQVQSTCPSSSFCGKKHTK